MLASYKALFIKLVVSFPLFLLTLEICARVDDAVRYDAPFFGEYSYESRLLTRDEYGMTGKPNGHFQKWQLNNFGFRNGEVQLDKQQGVVRIACLGSSETFGYFEEPGHAWPAQLSSILNSQGEGRYEVMNTSIPGRLLRSNIVHLRERVLKFQPDVVILYQGAFNYMDPGFKNPSEEKPRSARNNVVRAEESRFSMELRIKSKARDIIKSIIPDFLRNRYRKYSGMKKLHQARAIKGYSQLIDKVPTDRLQALHEELETFYDLCRANNSQLILSTIAFDLSEEKMIEAWRFSPYLSEKGFTEGADTLNQAIVEFAEDRQIVCVDVAGRVPKDDLHMGDYVHLTNEGAQIVAEAFAEAILSPELQADEISRKSL